MVIFFIFSVLVIGFGMRLHSEPVFLATSSLKHSRLHKIYSVPHYWALKLALEIEKHRLLVALQVWCDQNQLYGFVSSSQLRRYFACSGVSSSIVKPHAASFLCATS